VNVAGLLDPRGTAMLTGPNIILTLKIAVGLCTLMLLCSLVALALGRPRLHGRINFTVAILLFVAVLGLEVLLRFAGINVSAHLDDDAKYALNVHLCFSIPLLPALVIMLVTGRNRWIRLHLAAAVVFVMLWIGMFVTGIFFLPQD
jgi:hypothetical protein